MSHDQILYILNRAVEFVADQADVSDGPDGDQVPNEAMQLAADLMGVIGALPAADWTLVPVVPTEDMIESGAHDIPTADRRHAIAVAQTVWSNMLVAAPREAA